MPQFTPAPPNENTTVEKAAFVAVIAGMSHEWSAHTTGITGFATVLRDDEASFDAETRHEFHRIILHHTQTLRQTALEVMWVAQILSGIPLTYVLDSVDLRDLVHRAVSCDVTTRHRGNPSVCWNEASPTIMAYEPHLFSVFSAMIYHGQRLAQPNTFAVSVQEVLDEGSGKTMMFVFSGETDFASFTDPDEWFTINQKCGSESIKLFLARELAQRYGGRVWVETANQTRFDFRLGLPIVQETTNE